MILIGNGPVPFAVTGPPAANGRSDGVTRSQGGNSAAPVETLPAATRAGTGQPPVAMATASGTMAVQPVLATAKTARTATDPEDLLYLRDASRDVAHGRSEDASTGATRSNGSEALYAPKPAPPLQQFAGVPSELSMEIARLRNEMKDLKDRLGEMDKSLESLRAGANIQAAAGTRAAEDSERSGVSETAATGTTRSGFDDIRRIFDPAQPAVDQQS